MIQQKYEAITGTNYRADTKRFTHRRSKKLTWCQFLDDGKNNIMSKVLVCWSHGSSFYCFSCSLIGWSWIISKVAWNVVFQTFFRAIFERSTVAETIGVTNYAASFGGKKCSENHTQKLLRWFSVDGTNNSVNSVYGLARRGRRSFGNPGLATDLLFSFTFVEIFSDMPTVRNLIFC